MLVNQASAKKIETAKQEAAKIEAAKQKAARQEAAKASATKTEQKAEVKQVRSISRFNKL